jgi:translation elongation factor EF-Tu-like GTPase
MMIQHIDFIAKLKYRTAVEGGRKTPAFSGYRPQLKFPFTEMQTSGHQFFVGTDKVFPGDTVITEIRMNSPEFFLGMLETGMYFEFREGPIIIATGTILEILNEDLLKNDNPR